MTEPFSREHARSRFVAADLAQGSADRKAPASAMDLSGRATALCGVGLALWALALCQPWLVVPFESGDFSDLLPIFRSSATFAERHEGLSAFYRGHGRYFPLTLLYTNLKWTLFGWDVPAWQWLNAMLMLGTTALGYVFLRRVGASRAGALAGASCYIFAASTGQLWARVHYSEPQGMPMLLGAAILAAGLYRDEGSAVMRGLWAALLLACAVLVKEVFVVTVPFVVLLAACYRGGGAWDTPRLDRRTITFGLLVGAATALAIVPVLVTKAQASAGAYASQFGSDTIGPRTILSMVRLMFFPMTDTVRRPFPELAFTAAIAVGLMASRAASIARRRRYMLAVALSLPAAGAAIYAPWPWFQARYAAPFVLGMFMLLAFSVTCAMQAGGWRRPAMFALLAYLGVYGSLRNAEELDNFNSQRVYDAAILHGLADATTRGGAREILVAMAEPEQYCRTCFLANSFARGLLPQPLPPARAVTCSAALDAVRASSAVVVMDIGRDGPEWQRECRSADAGPRPADTVFTQDAQRRFTGRPGPRRSFRSFVWYMTPATTSAAGGQR